MKMLKIFKAAKAAGQSALHDLDPRNGLGEALYLTVFLLYNSAQFTVLDFQRRYVHFRGRKLRAEHRRLLLRCRKLLAEDFNQGDVFQQLKEGSHGRQIIPPPAPASTPEAA